MDFSTLHRAIAPDLPLADWLLRCVVDRLVDHVEAEGPADLASKLRPYGFRVSTEERFGARVRRTGAVVEASSEAHSLWSAYDAGLQHVSEILRSKGVAWSAENVDPYLVRQVEEGLGGQAARRAYEDTARTNDLILRVGVEEDKVWQRDRRIKALEAENAALRATLERQATGFAARLEAAGVVEGTERVRQEEP